MFLETSALTGENVEEAFLKCARTIHSRIENGDIDPDRIGSGIQFGDTSLRTLNKRQNNNTNQHSQCGFSRCML